MLLLSSAQIWGSGPHAPDPPMLGDGKGQRVFTAWAMLWLSECWRIAKLGAPLMMFTDWRQLPAMTDAMQGAGWFWLGIVVWNRALRLEQLVDFFLMGSVVYTTLNKTRMADLRRRYNVRTILVDLTRDEGAGRYGKELLKALGSTSIPMLALFPVGENAHQPVVLRDLVTPAQLEEAAAKIF